MSKTYACSDLHGMYDLYSQINTFIQPEDSVICLGDCGDRGPDGWRIIKEVAQNPQWLYLKGNHEDMLAKAIINYYDEDYSSDYELLCYNGGGKTYQDWGEDTSWMKDWGNFLKKLPYQFDYENNKGQIIHLSHAGYNPRQDRTKELTEKLLLWDRNHMNTRVWFGEDNEFVVHGHTPNALAKKGRERPELLQIEKYCEGHKYNLDLASWYTGVACLLDLDTFEEHYFYTEPLKI